MTDSSLRRPALWTAALPLACAAHCLLAPLAALFVPFLAPATEIEAGLMLVSAALAIGVTFSGVRVHGRRTVWIPVVLGIGVWGASLAGWTAPAPEPATTLLGSLLVAGGMVRNARLRHAAACRSCGCPAHPHAD